MKTDLKFGIELELATKRRVYDEDLPEGWESKGDGSIITDHYAYEFVSEPYSMNELTGFKASVRELYDNLDLAPLNSSMSTHVHVSFTDRAAYYALCCAEFAQLFQKKFKATYKTEKHTARLENRYAKLYENARDFRKISTAQLSPFRGSDYRYYAVNFNAFQRFKTIEFRLFPYSASANEAIRYVDFTLELVNDYLLHSRFKPLTATLRDIPQPDINDPSVVESESGEINDNMTLNYEGTQKMVINDV